MEKAIIKNRKNPADYSARFKKKFFERNIFGGDNDDILSNILNTKYKDSLADRFKGNSHTFESIINKIIKFNLEKSRISLIDFNYFIESDIPSNIVGNVSLVEDALNYLIDFIIINSKYGKITLFADYRFISINEIGLCFSLVYKTNGSLGLSTLFDINYDDIENNCEDNIKNLKIITGLLKNYFISLKIKKNAKKEIKFSFEIPFKVAEKNSIQNIEKKPRKNDVFPKYNIGLSIYDELLNAYIFQKLQKYNQNVVVISDIADIQDKTREYDCFLIDDNTFHKYPDFKKSVIKNDDALLAILSYSNNYLNEDEYKDRLADIIVYFPLNVDKFLNYLTKCKRVVSNETYSINDNKSGKDKSFFSNLDSVSGDVINIFINDHNKIVNKIREDIDKKDCEALIYDCLYFKEIIKIFKYQRLIDVLHQIKKKGIESNLDNIEYYYNNMLLEIENLINKLK
ncbi:MAG TPA: hypothetical protein PK385_06550 [Spirochaetota bacterium]|nr:hypothetical protein [Spirochaetota bacterium]HOS33694.1 hypothetical protein [Spirochaetota bacterium]HOS55702.1 hypothetical protein [Spirochaetota bacterium]HPK61907.1 hypothetical protein [Spirochaetota bacterium]HQF78335.1 hypothetical protein [Spirochaetota bacterium]